MKTGIELIAAERLRQIDEEGFNSDHDDDHSVSELAVAAAALITCDWKVGRVSWPWDNGIKILDRKSNLVRAGALIAAEIDRLNRSPV